ncbi:hypothetical protein HGO38_21725 [Rhizobium sp. CG5]|uniref:hypothetical protein n=1 Tax=Rhizobium sp. CG5 TaxID=2726076 RepID=UPI002033FB18|nr:hypothetical protein [Rhizobium sp. CG5]MCM2476100.1 hypothetical protein [Rhizobium sp. CG5]
MRRRKTVYLLDPFLATLRRAAISDKREAEDIKTLIGCDGVDAVAFDEAHSVYFDDVGLNVGITGYTTIDGHADPLGGRLVITHNDAYQNAPAISLEACVLRLNVFRAVMDPIIDTSRAETGELITFISVVTGFRLRIASVMIEIIDL